MVAVGAMRRKASYMKLHLVFIYRPFCGGFYTADKQRCFADDLNYLANWRDVWITRAVEEHSNKWLDFGLFVSNFLKLIHGFGFSGLSGLSGLVLNNTAKLEPLRTKSARVIRFFFYGRKNLSKLESSAKLR